MRRAIFVGLALLIALVSLLSAVTEVRPGERAVVRRFGRVLDDKPKPGLWIGLPWGIDRVDRVPVDLARRLLVGYQPEAGPDSVQTPPGQLLTGDHNLVNVQVALIYSVVEDRVEDYVVQAEQVDSLVARAAETALAEWVAGRTVDEVLLHGKAALPAWLVRKTQERIAPLNLGVEVREEASVTYLYPPDEVRSAFDDVTRAQTEIRTSRNKAEQEAERLLREAEADRFRIEQLTAAHVREQRLLAEADADSFERRRGQYERFRKENPAFLAGIWWEEMGKLFGQLKDNGRIDLLDHHLGADGIDITQFPPMPSKK
jgi:membrane protease subunit HflK